MEDRQIMTIGVAFILICQTYSYVINSTNEIRNDICTEKDERCLMNLEIKKFEESKHDLLVKNRRLTIGGQVRKRPNKKEINRNRYFQDAKREFLQIASNDTGLISKHFLIPKYKKQIEQTKLFSLIQKLPKGCSLHTHMNAMVPEEYIMENVTKRDNLYVMLDNNTDILGLKFFNESPSDNWKLVSKIRNENEEFAKKLSHTFTMISTDPDEDDLGDLNERWVKFEGIFNALRDMLDYKPVFVDCFYMILKTLYDDNIRYAEIRNSFSLHKTVYDLDGKKTGAEDIVNLLFQTAKKFKEDYPEFWGVKIIMTTSKKANEESIKDWVLFVERMKKKFPSFIAGFDLVGQENLGGVVSRLFPYLLRLKKTTNFIYHAGETLSSGTTVDENLVDAVVFNALRIGHGYALLKHPELLPLIKEKNICLEICPISNQILGLVDDPRNHPANYLIANNFPVVIGSDDPSLWSTKGLSYDWFVTITGLARADAGLKLLKQLAINSIKYSSMDKEMKSDCLQKFEKDWQNLKFF